MPNTTDCPDSVCTIDLAAVVTAIAIQNHGSGDVLLTAVSIPSPVPEPASLALLGTALARMGSVPPQA